MTEYYVSLSGSEGNNGLTEATAWRHIAYAATKAQAGDTVNIKGGNYGHEHVVIQNCGTLENYIIFKAYNGEVILNGEDVTGYGIHLNGRSYITIDGITVTRYKFGILGQGNAHHVNIYNTTAYQNHNGIGFEYGPHDIHIQNCEVYNSVMSNIVFTGVRDSLIEDCINYANPALIDGGWFKTDYGYILTGKTDGTFSSNNNILRNCTMLGGPWHGFALRHGSSNNKLINCRSYDTLGEHFAPKELSEYNEFINCVAAGYKETAATSTTKWSVGFNVKSSNNKFINCVATDDVLVGIAIGSGVEALDIPHNNLFKNCIVANCRNQGINLVNGENNILRYNDVWNNGQNYVGCTPGVGDISNDPLFVDAPNKDFHLKSQYGRWNGASWVEDAVTSPCIDAGDPSDDCCNEPLPNGGRINMGAYGNTEDASKSGPVVITGIIPVIVIDKDTGLPISGVKIIANGYETITE